MRSLGKQPPQDLKRLRCENIRHALLDNYAIQGPRSLIQKTGRLTNNLWFGPSGPLLRRVKELKKKLAATTRRGKPLKGVGT